MSLDAIDLSTSENLENFRHAILEKIRKTDDLQKKTFYVTFIEDLLKELLENGKFITLIWKIISKLIFKISRNH